MMNKDEQQQEHIDLTEHDLLIRIDERVGRMETWSTNHDAHHFRYNLLAWTVALGAMATLIIFIVTK